MTKKAVGRTETGDLTGLIVFTFDDNSTETFDASKVPESLHLQLLVHGASQKIGDSYAGAKQADDPLAFAKESVKDTIAQLYAGDWRVSGTGEPKTNDLVEALKALITDKTADEIQEFVVGLDDNQKKAWRAKPKVAAKIAEIQANRATERAKKLAEKAGAAETAEESLALA